ncbi:MAG: Fic family protein [Actinomycetota bacterium]
MPGQEVAIDWGGRSGHAWLPEPLLPDRPARLDLLVARTAEASAEAVLRLGRALSRRPGPATLLLRAEAMASSSIEGVRAPAEQVAAAQLYPAKGAAAWVADNLAVLQEALTEPADALTVAAMHRWHARLMRHSRLPARMIGTVRRQQSWIGGASPLEASFVPPPPVHVPVLLEDLVAYANLPGLDPVVQAGVAHAQFETIHPYADGNGRIGRVLVGWILARRLQAPVPPPLSVVIARDIDGYVSGLQEYRRGPQTGWIGWFVQALQASALLSLGWIGEVERAQQAWRASIEDLRSDAAARTLVEALPAHPVLSVNLAAELTEVSRNAALSALKMLQRRGILDGLTVCALPGPGRPPHLWVCPELTGLVEHWTAG